jgi:hypothetical protein
MLTLMFLLMMGNDWGLLKSATSSKPIASNYGPKPMPRPAKTDCGGGTDKPTPPDDKQDMVITPAGPMPKQIVQPVGPNETVRRNEDGTYTTVPNPNP